MVLRYGKRFWQVGFSALPVGSKWRTVSWEVGVMNSETERLIQDSVDTEEMLRLALNPIRIPGIKTEEGSIACYPGDYLSQWG